MIVDIEQLCVLFQGQKVRLVDFLLAWLHAAVRTCLRSISFEPFQKPRRGKTRLLGLKVVAPPDVRAKGHLSNAPPCSPWSLLLIFCRVARHALLLSHVLCYLFYFESVCLVRLKVSCLPCSRFPSSFPPVSPGSGVCRCLPLSRAMSLRFSVLPFMSLVSSGFCISFVLYYPVSAQKSEFLFG